MVLLTCAWAISHAQVNLVLNPSFEQYTKCPEAFQQILFCKYWDGLDSTYHIEDSLINNYIPVCIPAYCNACSTGSMYASLPFNGAFYQYPRTGNGLSYSLMYDDTDISRDPLDAREYLQGRFYKSLTTGTSYCVTFYVNLMEYSSYAIDKIGAYIDDGTIDFLKDSSNCFRPQTSYVPQIYSRTIINDTENWVMIQGAFIATGTEKFITIGNFFSHSNIDIESTGRGGGYSFYLIDDVSVMPSNSVADAGADAYVSPGSDSAWIGPHEEAWPCKWRIAGDTTVISVYTGFKVLPDTTTRYVMELDLCDNVTFDTVVVYVAPAGVPFDRLTMTQSIFPNPTSGVFTIEHAKGCAVVVYDVVGSARLTMTIMNDKQQVDISGLANGVYSLVITDPATKERTTQMLVKAR